MESKIKERRIARGMKQAELADLVEIGQSTLSEIETGRHAPNVYIAMRIAKALKTNVYELFTDPDQ